MKAFLQQKNFKVTWMNDAFHRPGDPLYSGAANIKRSVRRLVQDAAKGDVIWIQYSGHGLQKRRSYGDSNTDEKDGRDEAIVPADYDRNRKLIDDDWFRKNLVEPLDKKEGVEVFAMFDCCHSGSMMDLPYTFNWGKFVEEPNARHKLRSNVVYLSGCSDGETAKEISVNGVQGGALTLSWVNMIKQHGDKLTLEILVKTVTAKVARYDQTPVLSSSKIISPKTKFCDLIDGNTGASADKDQYLREWKEVESAISRAALYNEVMDGYFWYIVIGGPCLLVGIIVLVYFCCCCCKKGEESEKADD